MGILSGGPLYMKGMHMADLRKSMRRILTTRNDENCFRYRLTDMRCEGILHCSAMDVVDYVEENAERMGLGELDIPEGSVAAFRKAVLAGKYDAQLREYWERYDYSKAHPVPMSDPDHWKAYTGGYAAEGQAPLCFRGGRDGC